MKFTPYFLSRFECLRVSLGAIAIACFATTATHAFGDEELATHKASSSSEEALKRFVRECVRITPGEGKFPATFAIGADNPRTFEIKTRDIALRNPFRMSKYEVTQELYQAVTGKTPSRWPGPRNSVERISYSAAVGFCKELTLRLRQLKQIAETEVVRLPTADEWEYCCRAGSRERYCFGDAPGKNGTEVLDEYAWHTGNAAGNDPAVGILKANAWGVYDMHGYLWEFVRNEPGSTADSCEIRGGSWKDASPWLSCSSYLTISRSQVGDHIGFRCVIASEQK